MALNTYAPLFDPQVPLVTVVKFPSDRAKPSMWVLVPDARLDATTSMPPYYQQISFEQVTIANQIYFSDGLLRLGDSLLLILLNKRHICLIVTLTISCNG